MGEYFKGKKLGTCEHLMYVTRKEILDRVNQYPNEKNTNAGNLDYLRDYLDLSSNFIYRFEFEDESMDSWDKEREAFKTIVLDIESDRVEVPHRDFHQMHLDNGECYNVPFCFYSDKAKEFGIKKISSPNRIKIEIVGERYREDCPDGYTLLKCNCCGEMFSLSEDESEYISEQLRFSGYNFEADKIKPRIKREKITKDSFITKVIKENKDSMVREILGNINLDAKEVANLLLEKLNSLTVQELNVLSKRHLLNCNIF